MEYQPFLTALVAFVGVYLVFFLIRVFVDMYLVAVALSCAVAAYSIQGFNLYADFRQVLIELGLLKFLGLNLPLEPNTGAVIFMTALIVLTGVMLSLPVLPFSATYRYMLGTERLTSDEESKIKRWIQEEVERYDNQTRR